ncbi:YciI family protein [Pedobacter miscanthi]|jgi:hypothetical protein|uniref:Transcription initiation protein n=1 Tax=Pedobacter miscanthi TaxID=2259170 RepID=A0A366KYX9_9SPHI|nr:YciI family protein [Pedobacter miscanthi]RBQ06845.1 transcription initiation protein [Pedobacter miscanthi]
MDEFLLIFRRAFMSPADQPSPDELQASIKKWQDWFGSIAAQDRLVRPLQRWDLEGRVIDKDRKVTNGPFAEIKESIGGLILIRAEDYQQALKIAEGCPILDLGGTVEVRQAV